MCLYNFLYETIRWYSGSLSLVHTKEKENVHVFTEIIIQYIASCWTSKMNFVYNFKYNIVDDEIIVFYSRKKKIKTSCVYGNDYTTFCIELDFFDNNI